jgi:hypothetical protein
MAIHAGHTIQSVRRGDPRLDRMPFMAIQAEIDARFRFNLAVWIMASLAFKSVWSKNLVWVGEPL